MNCPYCHEQVNHGATVCKTCQRDIALVVSLQDANDELEAKVRELEAELAELRERGPVEPAAVVDETPARGPGILDIAAVYFLLPTVLLIGAHYLLVIRFDTSLVWLRTVSIVLPAVFGFAFERKARPHWFATLGIGIVVAAVAVLGMSTLVFVTDGDPILPKGAVAWRETLEYIASISLGYLLGGMLARAVRPRGARISGRMTRLATFITLHLSGKKGKKPLEVRVQQMIKLIQLGISASTAIGAVYTGFKSIL